MPLERNSGNLATLPLESRVARDGTAAICREINIALAPIIGIGSVDALHARSRHLCTASHAWVAGLDSARSSGCDALETLLKQREPSEALSGGKAYLQAFHELLVSLMGALGRTLVANGLEPCIKPNVTYRTEEAHSSIYN